MKGLLIITALLLAIVLVGCEGPPPLPGLGYPADVAAVSLNAQTGEFSPLPNHLLLIKTKEGKTITLQTDENGRVAFYYASKFAYYIITDPVTGISYPAPAYLIMLAVHGIGAEGGVALERVVEAEQ